MLCSVSGDESRITMIKCFRTEDICAVIVAEYFQYEDFIYDIRSMRLLAFPYLARMLAPIK
jgi:hypothetical protein